MTILRMPNGRQLNYLDIGKGPALVLLHGWAMSSGIFAGIVDGLAKNFRLLIPDMRGHGASETGTDYALSDFTADITTWIDRLGLDRCNLIGWSFGGQVAMRLAADKLLPIERLAIVASTPKFCQSSDWHYGLPEVQVRAMERQFRRDSVSTLAEFTSLMFVGEKNAQLSSAVVHKQTILPDAGAGAKSLATLRETDIRDLLSKINIPTLVHHGKADMIIPVSAGEYLAGQIAGAELFVWDEVGHAPFLSSPEDSQTLWQEFML